ncbi:unnamed protein product, partial [marine sediment metagenome]
MIKIARLISGTRISQDIKNEITEEVKEMKRTKEGVVPGLAAVLVGDNPA